MNTKEALFNYLLRLGDNALIHGHRLSEWCSKGPTLEEDLALTNIALDNIGRAQALLKYAAEIEGKQRNEDSLAYRRGEREFFNNLMVELPNGDFAFTIARMMLMSAYEVLLYDKLTQSSDATLAGIALKAVKEARYHFAHARDWCFRLGKGTDLSKQRIQNAIYDIWMYTGELFEMNEIDQVLISEKIVFDLNAMKAEWITKVEAVLTQSEINIPKIDYMQTGSRKGLHTENLGFILTELQYLQRAYPDAQW